MKLKHFILALVAMLSGFAFTANAQVSVGTLDELQDALKGDNNSIVITKEIQIPVDETVELDLNGKTVTVVYQEGSDSRHIYALNNYGTLTIKGEGSIEARGIFVQNGSKLTVEGGSIYGIDSNGGSALYQYGGDILIEGGHIEQKAEGTHNFAINALGGTVTVNGGWIGGNHGAIATGAAAVVLNGGEFVCTGSTGMTDNVLYTYDSGTIEINGGTFVADKDIPSGGACVYDANGKTTINGGTFGNSSGGDVWGTTGTTIKGGTFENLTETQHVTVGSTIVNGGKAYVKTESGKMEEVELPSYVAKIGTKGYATFAEALAAAKTMTSEVVVELFDKVTLNGPLTGSYSFIKFVGKNEKAEIYMDVQGYVEAAGKKVAFEDLKLSKVAGGYIANAGFMNLAFGVYGSTEATYTNCTFLNGAYAATGNVTYTDCTFNASWDRYAFWAYGDANITIDNCKFDAVRGIKMYDEGKQRLAAVTVKNSDFSVVSGKPAIVLTSGESVVLEGNTYSSTGVFELDLDGNPNGTPVTSDVAPTCVNDNGACGVLVDGKIYTTVAQAAEVATSGSAVKLLHNSAETVELAEGVVLDKNDFEAAGVTVKLSATKVATLAELQAALAADNELPIIITETIVIPEGETVVLDLNGKTVTCQDEANQYALRNLGDLTIKDTKGNGSINARGIYNGYGNGGANVATAEITVLSGTINAKGTNGGAAIFNYGVADIQGGSFTSIGGYSLNCQSGASMTIADGVTANNGIYVSGATLVVDGGEISGNRSGCHVLYAWNSNVTIAGGTFHNNNSGNSTTMAGGTTKLTINGGTFSIANGKSTNGWTSCLIDATDGGKYEINGGEFKGHFRVQANCAMEINGGTFENTHGEAYVNGGTVAVKGGSFTDAAAQKFAKDNLAAGCAALPNLDGQFVVGVAPTATVENIGSMVVEAGDYYVHNLQGSGDNSKDMPLQFVMKYTADQSAEEVEDSPYKEWYADFVLSFSGLANGSFVADEDTYLAGFYGETEFWSGIWAKVGITGMEITEGTRYPVMMGVGMPQNYEYICAGVEEFLCAMNISSEILAANPDLKVTLELCIVDNSDDTKALEALQTGGEMCNVAAEKEFTAEDFVAPVSGLTGAGTEDNPYLIKSVNDLILFRNSVNEGVANKYNAPGVWVALGADIDLAGENWVGIGSAYKDHGFMGNFDGKTFKIKNLTITNPAIDSDGYVYAGLFSVTEGTDKNNQNVIKNLTIENVNISATGHIVSAAIAYPYYTIVENVTVCGDIAISGGDYTAGALAYTRRCVNASNITVAGNAGSTITGAQVVGGVISDIQMNGGLIADYSNFSVSGVSITGTKRVGGISGIIATQTLNGATVNNVTLTSGDNCIGIVSGSFGGTCTITDVTYNDVTGADVIIGHTYSEDGPGAAVEAKIGDTYYSTLATAVQSTGDVTLLTDVTLKDDVAYASKSSKQVTGNITYTRNLTAFWNPIYLPFAVELSTEDYDVAKFDSAEGETVTLTKSTGATATLAANTAYVIRPKNDDAKTLTITLEDATLEAATVNEQVLGDDGFSVKGNYSVLKGADLGANDRVVGTNGNWGVLNSASTLKPFRLILTIPAGAQAISMHVNDGDVTSIENIDLTNENNVIFDLTGRRVETITEGGIYIVNGKKMVF